VAPASRATSAAARQKPGRGARPVRPAPRVEPSATRTFSSPRGRYGRGAGGVGGRDRARGIASFSLLCATTRAVIRHAAPRGNFTRGRKLRARNDVTRR
jgi:hypothetical protein